MFLKYQELLIDNCEGIEAVKRKSVMDDDEFWGALDTIFKSAMSHPEEVINHYFIFYQLKITCMLANTVN